MKTTPARAAIQHGIALLLAVVALALLGLFLRPAAAQSFNIGSNPWVQKTTTYGTAVVFPLAAASVFKLTLTGDATSTATQAAGAKGKHVSFLICQDDTGGHSFAWPTGSYGGAAVPALPGWCLAQAFLVADGQLWADSAGNSASLIPPPSMLAYPLTGGHHFNQGGFSLANAPFGVLATNSSGTATGYHAFFLDGIGHNYDGDNAACIAAVNCRPRSITVTFYLDNPPAGSTQSFGIVYSTMASAAAGYQATESCLYLYGNGTNAVTYVAHYWRITDDDVNGPWPLAALGAATFTSSSAVMMLRASQAANGDKTCSWSTDRGATWAAGNNTGHTSQWGLNNSMGHFGLIAKQPDTGDRVYLMGITVVE